MTQKHFRALAFCALALALTSPGCRRKPRARNVQPEQNHSVPATLVKLSEVTFADPAAKDHIIQGIYDGDQGWRWTAHKFSVLLDVPPPFDAPTRLEVDYGVPSELIEAVHEVTVTARVNGYEAGRHRYNAPGRHTEAFALSQQQLEKTPALVEFELDKWGKDEKAGREIGLQGVSVSLKHPDDTVIDHDTATELARRGYTELLQRRKMAMTDRQQNEMMKLFHEIPIWRNLWFHNVPIAKNPLDLWMMQQIMYETQPEFVIETGTYMGGSALYWAHTLNGLGLENSRVITCDIGDYTITASKHPLWKKYVSFTKVSSTDPAFVKQTLDKVSGHKVIVTLDSDHSMQYVLKELRAYAPMVNKGSYLIVEDTHMDGVPTAPNSGPGPMSAVLEFLKEGGSKDFEQDLSREAFIMTFNPGGWLRRK